VRGRCLVARISCGNVRTGRAFRLCVVAYGSGSLLVICMVAWRGCAAYFEVALLREALAA